MVRFLLPKSTSLSRDDWLEAAMELLRTRGIGGVRVLPLAKTLGVSRGSFYWHFRNRQDLLDSMLEWWDREMTESVIQDPSAPRRSAETRLLKAADDILQLDLTRYETAIRTWAEADRKAAKVLKRVIRKRLGFITGLFRDLGFSPSEARARGDLLAVYLMSESTILVDETLEERLRLMRRQVRMLMG